jgi:hypothetical protein
VRAARRCDPDAALRRFGRRERGYLDHIRLQALDEGLRRFGPRAVAHTCWTMGGNRGLVELDDGTRMRLSLYWQGDGVVTSIDRVYFDDEVGWIVLTSRPSGERMRLVAFRIRVDAPTNGRGPTQRRH